MADPGTYVPNKRGGCLILTIIDGVEHYSAPVPCGG